MINTGTIEKAPQVAAPNNVESFNPNPVNKSEILTQENEGRAQKPPYIEAREIPSSQAVQPAAETREVPVKSSSISAGYELVDNPNHPGNAALIDKINHVEPEIG